MITLQTLIFPEPGICTEHALYFHTDGAVAVSHDRAEAPMATGGRMIFDTYFNLLNLDKWRRTCRLDGLWAEIEGTGRVELRAVHALPGRSWEMLFCEIVTLEADPTRIDLSELVEAPEAGLVHLEVMALDPEGARFTGGRFVTGPGALPEELPRLAISITTFKREAQVRHTVDRLEAFLDGFAHGDRIHVQVVDNGQSAGIAPSPRVSPMPNPNLGGAGGFARGLLEAEKAGFSHCLFMDDDASFHMENIARTYVLLALAKDRRAALAGAMINNSHKWSMWENGAWFDGACRPLHSGLDLRDAAAVREMEFDSARHRPATLYGGWWFFAFAIDRVRHRPFPFFVRGDDISFSLANGFDIVTMNGVVSFQDDFTEKESAQTLYLDLRNHLIHHLVFDGLARSPLGTARVAIRFVMRSLLRMHYESAEAQLLAWRDVMRGPDFFDANIDMSERRARIKAMIRDEVWTPLPAPPAPGQPRFTRMRRKMRHYLGLSTLNGHLLPFWRRLGDRSVLPIGDRGLVFPAFGAARITYLNTARDKGYTVTHSKRRFYALAWEMTRTLIAFLRGFDRLKADWREGYGAMTQTGYWERTLERESAAPKAAA